MGAAATTTDSLVDHQIRDFASFKEVTEEPHQVAGLYFFQKLDCLVELAYLLSYDFFKRPHRYTDLGDLRATLARMHSRLGYDEFLPSKNQRDEIYLPIFGQGGGYATAEDGDFPRLRDDFLDTIARFVERVPFETGADALRKGVRTAHRPFADYLRGLLGDSVRWSREDALATLTEEFAYAILRSHAVATGVFGIPTPDANSPYTPDSNFDKVVDAVSEELVWVGETADHHITRERISNLQRAASSGTVAIASVIDYKEETASERDLDLLISQGYIWLTALRSLAMKPAVAAADRATAPVGVTMGRTALPATTVST